MLSEGIQPRMGDGFWGKKKEILEKLAKTVGREDQCWVGI